MAIYPVEVNGQMTEIDATSAEEASRKAYTAFRQGQRPTEMMLRTSEMVPSVPPTQEAGKFARGIPRPADLVQGERQAMRDAAAFAARTAPGIVTAPTLPVPGLGQLVPPAANAAGETLAQLIEAGKVTSPEQIGISALIPPVVSGGAKLTLSALKGVASRLPGAAKVLQEEAVSAARAIPEAFRASDPAGRAKALYDQLEKLNPRIPSANLRDAVNELMTVEIGLPSGLQGQLRPVLDGLNQLLKDHGGEIPFQQLRSTLRRLGQRTGSVEGLEANELRSGFKYLDRAVQQDLEQAANAGAMGSAKGATGQAGAAATLLQRANKLHARAKSIDELQEMIEGAVGKARSDLLQSFNPARALNALADSPNFARSFSPREQAEITATLRRFKYLPSLPPPGGEAAIGSGRAIGRYIVGTGLGAAAGSAMAGPVGTGVGMAVGAGAANAVHATIANLLATSPGRRLLLRTLNANGGTIRQQMLPGLAQAARAYLVADSSESGPQAKR